MFVTVERGIHRIHSPIQLNSIFISQVLFFNTTTTSLICLPPRSFDFLRYTYNLWPNIDVLTKRKRSPLQDIKPPLHKKHVTTVYTNSATAIVL